METTCLLAIAVELYAGVDTKVRTSEKVISPLAMDGFTLDRCVSGRSLSQVSIIRVLR